MAKKTDRMMSELGGSLAEAVGARVHGAPPAPSPGPVGPSPYDGQTRLDGAVLMPITSLVPDPGQPRKTFSDESLAELADSIRKRGLLSPARARWDPGVGKWVLINGERRWRAARLVGLEMMPVLCIDGALTPVEIRQEQLFDNLHREDLSDLEEAHAFKDYLDLMGCTQKELAAELCLSPSKVSRSLALLSLPPVVREQIADGSISAKSAIEIAKLPNPKVQERVAARAAKERSLRRK